MKNLLFFLLPIILFLGCENKKSSSEDTNITESEKPEENLTESEKPEENLTESEKPEENLTESEKPEENLTESEKPDDNFSVTQEIKIVDCGEEYQFTDLQSGDNIVPVGENANIKILHDQNGKKRACVSEGDIMILRNLYITGVPVD
jgi:hypothetical protein